MTDAASARPPLTVVVLAAGEGTRMRSRTPKVLHRIAGLPMIAHVLAAAAVLEPARLAVVVRHERNAVAAAVLEVVPQALIVDQDDVPGTGRAVEQAVEALGSFEGDLMVLNGDLPLLDARTLRALLDAYLGDGAAAAVLTAHHDDPTGGGRIIRAADGTFERIVEERDASPEERALTEVNAGVYLFRAARLGPLLASLGTANAQGEKYLTDLVAALRQAGEQVAAVAAPDADLTANVNDRAQLATVAALLNRRIVRRWQLAGVTIKDPATTWIDTTVTLEPDVEVLPNTHLAGATTIARDAVVGPDTTLADCEVGEGAVVTRTQAELAVIGARASVGPFSYLRPGTTLGSGGKIGAYVETKNADIGAGSKVPHLSYVGDATVGEHSNIGAGTITANYDGMRKHRTTIGSHVRSGSNTVYVAPVSIGDGAYTGAGTVVRRDVPPGALALTVAPQRNLAGWVGEHRPATAAAAASAAADSLDAASGATTADGPDPGRAAAGENGEGTRE